MRLMTNEELEAVGGGDVQIEQSEDGYRITVSEEKMSLWEKILYDIVTPAQSPAEKAADKAYRAAYVNPMCDTTVTATENGVTSTSQGSISASPSYSIGKTTQDSSLTTTVKCKLP